MLKSAHGFLIAFFSIFGFLIVLGNLLAWQGISLGGRTPEDIQNTYFGMSSILMPLRNAANSESITPVVNFMKTVLNHMGNALTMGRSLPPAGMNGQEALSWWNTLDVLNRILQVLDFGLGWFMIPIYGACFLVCAIYVGGTFFILVLLMLGGVGNLTLPASHYDMPGAVATMMMLRNCCII